jgi:6-phosphogluconolactonase/glucosamine-6-phosphate isomerase/deaminase
MPWAPTTMVQVDERIGPADDPLRNLTGLRQALPDGCPARVVPMPVADDDLDAACARYAASLPHVALTGPYQDRRRMTLTYPAIGRARAVLWLVTGADKRSALARLRAHDHSIPAGLITNTDQVLLCDTAAVDAPAACAALPMPDRRQTGRR